jgi:hypothetical protein
VKTGTVGGGAAGGVDVGAGVGVEGGDDSGGDGGIDSEVVAAIAFSSTITSRYQVDGVTANGWLRSRSVMYGANQIPVHALAFRPV